VLLLKILYRFAAGVVALAAGITLAVVLMVFGYGTGILRDRSFIVSIEIAAFFIPIASALIMIPNAIREHRERKSGVLEEIKPFFWEPPE
jgi:FtsH-binding integral membrane protein